jgi:hypothetical protein
MRYQHNYPVNGLFDSLKNAASNLTAGWSYSVAESKAIQKVVEGQLQDLKTAISSLSASIQPQFRAKYDSLKAAFDQLVFESKDRDDYELNDIGTDVKRAEGIKQAISRMLLEIDAASEGLPPPPPPADADEASLQTTERLSVFWPKRVEFKEPFVFPWWGYLLVGSAVAGVVYWRVRRPRR